MTLPILKPGDTVEIIAPASRCTPKQLEAIKTLLASWQLNYVIADNIFGDDLFCANSDEIRFQHLKNALENNKTKAIICARGGYGSMRLIPQLSTLSIPTSPKLFVGMSDITALHLYFQQHWQWPTVHGASAPDRFSPESIASLKSILFGEVNKINYQGLTPLNQQAKHMQIIEGHITGGNLSLIQAGIGTQWQMQARNKIILLEDVDERAYRIDRMLEHLRQANIFKEATAILLGDFLEGKEPDGSSLIQPALNRFAESCSIPVVQMHGIGHGYTNFAIPLGINSHLHCGNEVKLTF